MYPKQSKLRATAANLHVAALLTAVFVASGSSIAHADAYTELNAEGKSYVKRVCMPVQHMKDTAAFRECVIEHANAISTANAVKLASLNINQRIAEQRDCSSTGSQNSAAGINCGPEQEETPKITTAVVSQEPISAPQTFVEPVVAVEETLPTPAAALPTEISVATTSVSQLADTLEQSAADALDTVTGDDAVDIAVQAVAVPATPSVPRTPTSTATNAVQTLATETENAAEPASELTDETVQATAQLSNSNDLNLVLAQNTLETDSESATPLENDSSSAPSDATDNENSSDSEAPVDIAKKLWTQLLASVEGVSGINKIIVIGAAALPLLLIGFWLLMRGRKKEPEYIPPAHSSSLRDRVRAYPEDELDDTLDTAADHSVASQQMYEDQVNELFADEDDPVLNDDIDETIAISPSMAPVVPTAKSSNDEISFEAESTKEVPKRIRADSEESMGSWLKSLEESEQLSIAIEFMIYWMAYTDERYQPELKKSVFAMENPDEHDLVKRRVLNQDTTAFAETTSWLQENTSAQQRVQIINLLMALLVNEEAITPVQNTMLRFLANAFGMSHERLDEMFQKAFEETLPPMPRPDKPSWWEQQPTDKLKRWDARSVAQQSQTIQSRVKLGLPLTGSLDAEDLDEKYKRAVSRCQPELFDLLSEREQQLAEQQQHKFDTAFDILKEVSA